MNLTPDEKGYIYFPAGTKTHTKLAQNVQVGDLAVIGRTHTIKQLVARPVRFVQRNQDETFIDIGMGQGFYWYLELNQEVEFVVMDSPFTIA
jgi:hypothetical protein